MRYKGFTIDKTDHGLRRIILGLEEGQKTVKVCKEMIDSFWNVFNDDLQEHGVSMEPTENGKGMVVMDICKPTVEIKVTVPKSEHRKIILE